MSRNTHKYAYKKKIENFRRRRRQNKEKGKPYENIQLTPKSEDKEWSLKGKLITSRNFEDILVDAEVNKYIFGSTDDIERKRVLNKEFGYTKQDIDTLREKLIEDMINRFKHECGTCGQAVILDDEIEKIINNRFGVDD